MNFKFLRPQGATLRQLRPQGATLHYAHRGLHYITPTRGYTTSITPTRGYTTIWIFAVFLVMSIVLSTSGKELLSNRDFEISTTDYWSPDPSGNSKFEIEKQRVFNGKYSAYIYMYSDTVAETYVYQQLNVKPDTIYTGSGYFYDSDFDTEVAHGYINIIWLDATGRELSSNSSISITENSSNWQYITTGRIRAPSSAKTAIFCVMVNKIRTSDSSKKIYIDDLSFVEESEVKSGDISVPKNYPNPFNPRPPKSEKTKIIIPEKLLGEKLEIQIYSLSGDKVRTIYSSEWDGKDSDNQYVQPGVYFYIVETEKGRAKGKMTVIK